MRALLLSVLCLVAVAAFALLAEGDAGKPVEVRLTLVEADSGKKISGIIRVLAKDTGKPVPLPGLFDRMRGFKIPEEYTGWHVVPAEGATLSLPPGKYTLQALCGLETELTTRDLDLGKKPSPSGRGVGGEGDGEEIKLPLTFIFRPEERGLVAGNTHLHLMKLTQKESDDYLRQVPAADRLKVLFISYLERKPDDKDYITNTYPIGDLKAFDATGVLMNNGEEHRHNFKAYGQGYGHVMFLGIKKLVKPVSIGPGIMGEGFDDTPLTPGIEDARKQGGTVIWCHNTSGYEDVINALAGRLHAINVFDGSRTGDFEGNYYRYLNIGIRMPISTGTDWFMYDFSRVYASLGGDKKASDKLTIPAWLDAVKAGRCQATNGPLLSLRVDGKEVGDTVKLEKPSRVKIEASGLGRVDFGNLELVHNGKVIESSKAAAKKGHFEGKLAHEMLVDQPGWFALRISATEKNEMGQTPFAHTSPIYVDMSGAKVFKIDDALELLKQLEEGTAAIRAQGSFSTPEARAAMEELYARAMIDLQHAARKGK